MVKITFNKSRAIFKADLILPLRLLLLSSFALTAFAQTPGRFNAVGAMITPRFFHTATLLPDGRVLITGGDSSYGGRGLATEKSAELYNPSTGTFTATASMTTPRDGHTATLLPDGKVLIAGGGPRIDGSGYSLASAELYDAATGKFVATGSMSIERWGHTATLLNNGKVLIAGGFRRVLGSTGFGVEFPISAELFDPSTGTFTATGNMTSAWADTATLLSNGNVLITRSDPDGIVGSQFLSDMSAVAGSSYSVNISGSNLASQTFFDVRFISPGSKESAVVLNWQRGLAASHEVPESITLGSWTITGVRAHEIETDHTGNFSLVSTTITVLP
jgi:Galactose oxidase, central domain